MDFPIVLIHFIPLKSGQPLYSGQITWSQCVLYREVPQYIHQLSTYYYAVLGCISCASAVIILGVYPLEIIVRGLSFFGTLTVFCTVCRTRVAGGMPTWCVRL